MTHSRIILLFLVYIFFIIADAVTFEIENQCPYTVWAAAVPGGGQQLDPTQSWSFNVSASNGRIWGRTGCIFDASGRGRCLTGDCGGLLQCEGSGTPPTTLIEYSLLLRNQVFFDISLLNGFNLPLDFIPVSSATLTCRGSLRCVGDIKSQCPNELRVPGGCNNACGVFKTVSYCCTNGSSNCGPTIYSRFFKQRCPAAYSYPFDDQTSLFTCPAGANYKVVFCPCVENICTVPSVS